MLKNLLKSISFILMFVTLCSFWPFSGGNASVKLKVKTLDSTNNGAPFYVYVKEVEKGEFLKDEYHHIVTQAFPTGPEGPAIHPKAILPGKNVTIVIPKSQEDKQLGIYFLFTEPGKEWKYLSSASKRIDVFLGDKEIASAKSK